MGETPEKAYIVKFVRPEMTIQPVIAARAEIHGDHLVFLDSDGRLGCVVLPGDGSKLERSIDVGYFTSSALPKR